MSDSERCTDTRTGPAALRTVGHGTLTADGLLALLHAAGVERLVDVRAHPGSRHNPHVGREQMERWVPEGGVAYAWLPQLGGRRRPTADSIHVGLRNASFRAYADHMESEEFLAGVEALLSTDRPTAVMCSESVWWRCHRRLLADHLTLARGIQVEHLMHDGRLTPHVPTAGARAQGGRVLYELV